MGGASAALGTAQAMGFVPITRDRPPNGATAGAALAIACPIIPSRAIDST
jgi:hypothetical protein